MASHFSSHDDTCWPARRLAPSRARAFGRGAASAQADWPTRPVRVIVPYPPAGGADTVSRILFQKLGEMWGQQFVIDNRGGAGGTIGEAVAAKADPDGYTILYDATAFSVNPVALSQALVRLRQGFPAGVPGLAGAEHAAGPRRRFRPRPSPT